MGKKVVAYRMYSTIKLKPEQSYFHNEGHKCSFKSFICSMEKRPTAGLSFAPWDDQSFFEGTWSGSESFSSWTASSFMVILLDIVQLGV